MQVTITARRRVDDTHEKAGCYDVALYRDIAPTTAVFVDGTPCNTDFNSQSSETDPIAYCSAKCLANAKKQCVGFYAWSKTSAKNAGQCCLMKATPDNPTGYVDNPTGFFFKQECQSTGRRLQEVSRKVHRRFKQRVMKMQRRFMMEELAQLTGGVPKTKPTTKPRTRRKLTGANEKAEIVLKLDMGFCAEHTFKSRQQSGVCHACRYGKDGCAAGNYHVPCDGKTTVDTSSCVACITTCDTGKFPFGTCSGTTTTDVVECKSCTDDCKADVLTTSGEKCTEFCDADPVFSSCPTAVTGITDPFSTVSTLCWTAVAATDAEDGSLAVTLVTPDPSTIDSKVSSKAFGSGYPIAKGVTQVKYTAKDKLNTAIECSFTVTITDGLDTARCNFGYYWDACTQSCLACTAEGKCAKGQYYDASKCQGYSLTDDSCVACSTATCATGHFVDATKCDGTGTSDDRCQPCTATGKCSAGFFFDASKCVSGLDTADVSCQACKTKCSAGQYLDMTKCDGTKTADDRCAACTTTGNCAAGFFFDSTKCKGDGTSNDSCQSCHSEGSCPKGSYHVASQCDGKGTAITSSCKVCTAVSKCANGKYFDATKCDGTGTTDDSCQPCTTSGNCPAQHYYDTTSKCAASGLGLGTSDDACKKCTALDACPKDHYYEPGACTGKTSADSSCVACTKSDSCPKGEPKF